MSNAPVAEYQYDYTKAQTPGISVEQLDELAKRVFDPDKTTGWGTVIWCSVKLVVALAYVWARAKLREQQMLLEKQQYLVEQTKKNQQEVDNLPDR